MGFTTVTTGCGLDNPTMTIFQWKDQESYSCLVHETWCLWSPNLVLEPWRTPIKLPVFVFNLHWRPEETGSNTSTGMPQLQDRWACHQEWEQASKKQRLPSSMPFYVGYHQKKCGPYLRWVFSPQMIRFRKYLTGMPSVWVLVDSKYRHVDSQDQPARWSWCWAWSPVPF